MPQWEPVKYFNNQIICDLIEEKHRGIIAYLDEECLRPGDANDFTFLAKLGVNLGSHPHMSVVKVLNHKNRPNAISDVSVLIWHLLANESLFALIFVAIQNFALCWRSNLQCERIYGQEQRPSIP